MKGKLVANLDSPKSQLIRVPGDAPGSSIFHIADAGEGTNKIARKNSVVCRWVNGKVGECGAEEAAGSAAWALNPKSSVYYNGAVVTLTALIKDKGATVLYGYKTFAAGAPPKSFELLFKTPPVFQPAADRDDLRETVPSCLKCWHCFFTLVSLLQ